MPNTWNNPTDEEIREALEGWEWEGWKMTNITIERVDEDYEPPVEGTRNVYDEHGLHVYAVTDFEKNGDPVGHFRVRYRADGVSYLEHVYLYPGNTRTGAMTALLDDFLPYYKQWGLDRVQLWAPAPSGAGFAVSQGFSVVEDDDTLYERTVE